MCLLLESVYVCVAYVLYYVCIHCMSVFFMCCVNALLYKLHVQCCARGNKVIAFAFAFAFVTTL